MKAQGLIQVYTGDGKGKTTAAFGVALRVLGHGGRVGVVQFFKRSMHNAQRATNASTLTVDRCALRNEIEAGEIKALRKFSARFKIFGFGGGFTWSTSREVNQKAVDKAWKKCREILRDPKYSLVIFDEINIALHYKFLKTKEVIQVLKRRPVATHVILTGRGAPSSLMRVADLVSEMKCIKHPFRKGILAQPGLDF